MQRQLAKPVLLVSLCLLVAPAFAENRTASRHKLAMVPASMPVPPHVARTPGRQPRVQAVPAASRIRKASQKAYPATHLQKGYYYKQKGCTNEALIEFILATEENPRDTRAFFEQAQLFKQTGKAKLAMSSLEQALAVAPSNTQARTFLVQLHFESGNLLGAAAEVGKMFGINQAPRSSASTATAPRKAEPSGSSAGESKVVLIMAKPDKSAPANQDQKNTTESSADETSAWLHQAATQADNTKTQTVNPSLADVLTHIGQSTETPAQTSAGARQEEAQPRAGATPQVIAAADPGTAKSLPAAATAPGHPGLLYRVRSGATHAMSGFARPVPDWVKMRLPLAAPRNEQAAAPQAETKESRAKAALAWVKEKVPFTGKPKTDAEQSSPRESHTQALVTWLREKIPFVGQDKAPGADNTASAKPGKLASMLNGVKAKLPSLPHPAARQKTETAQLSPAAKPQRVSQFAHNLKQHLPFVHHGDQNHPAANLAANPVSKTTFGSASASKTSDLPPEIARALEGKFNSPAMNTVTVNNQPNPDAALLDKSKAMDKEINRILSGIGKPDAEKQAEMPVAPGPDYGLLKNNALKRVGVPEAADLPAPEPSLLEKIMADAGKTISSMIPKVNWSMPSLPSIPGLHSHSSDAVVASVPALKPESNSTAKAAENNKSVPLDVSRILNRLSSQSAPQAAPALEKLSASIPVAGAPAGIIDEIIARPSAPRTAAMPATTSAPLASQSEPQKIPDALIMQAAPIVESAISQVQPLLKPTLSACGALAEKVPTPVSNQSRTAGIHILPSFISSLIAPRPAEPKAPQTASAARPPLPALPQLPVLQPSTMQPLQPGSPAAPAAPTHLAQPVLPAPQIASTPAQLPSVDRRLETQPAPAANPGLPTMQLQGLAPATGRTVPQSSPQSTPQPLSQPLAVQLPPVVQEALDKIQPFVKPALDGAGNLMQSIAPLAIPKSLSLPEPVQKAWVNDVTNRVPVPVPVGADMQKYIPADMSLVPVVPAQAPIEELSAGPARKLVELQKGKSGAFTFMKPVFDSDFLVGNKQVRTLQAPAAQKDAKQAAAKEKPKEEDPVTKRMRYLLEHGTGNLRKGEAFMFSEETGEGTLFLPDGTSERRKLQEGQDAEKVLRARRPDIINPKDIQYTLTLLGKLLPPQQQQQNNNGSNEPVCGPTLEQLMSQMNQQSKGFFGWIKKSLNINN